VVVYAYVDYEEDVDLAQMNFDDAVANVRGDVMAQLPRFGACDEWIGREDRAILASPEFYVGVSEYCGIVAVWAVPRERDDDEDGEPLTRALSAARLQTLLHEVASYFGETLEKVGTFSNGEAVFRRAA
jgi:hypothetical protein